MTTDETFSDQLEAWLSSDEPKTLGSLGDVFGEKSFATTVLFLMLLPAIPLPTGGITHVFEAITVVVAAQMVLGQRTLWLPGRWKHRALGDAVTQKAIPFMVRAVRRFERLSRPRGQRIFQQGWTLRLIGLLLIGLAIGAALAPPFSGLDTLPALGAVAVALSIILEDVVILAIGTAIGTGGILIIVTLGAALVRVVQSIV
jgi:hypothetical protein